MNDKGIKNMIRRRSIILIAIGMGIFYWVLESVIHYFVFQDYSLIQTMFILTPNELWMRLTILGFLIIFGFYSQSLIKKRKWADERLQQSEENLRAYLESAPDGIYINDLKGTFLYGNKKAEEIMGYEREELIGKSFLNLKLLLAKDLAKAGKLLALNAMGKPTGPDEFELVRKDSSHISVEINTTPIKQGGKIVVIGLVRDITERKRAEEEIRKFKTIADKAPYGVSIASLEGDILYVNEAYARMYGCTVEEMLGRHYTTLYTEESLQAMEKFRYKLLREGTFFVEELWRKRKDGAAFPSLTTAGVIKDDQGNPLYIAATAIDITKRKQAEDALRESEERYRALLELSGEVGEAVVMLQDTDDKEAVHVFATGEWSRITGYSRKELLGMSWLELLHPDYREATVERYQRRIGGEILPGLFELLFIRKDSAEVPVEITAGPTTYRGKSALVVYARDITRRKRLEQEREKLIQELQKTLQEVKTLSGLLPICAWCKKFRDDEGYWKSVEEYLGEHTGAEFTHGICPECAAKLSDRG